MADNVVTGPIAIIRKGGSIVGHMRDVSVTESESRQNVQGLGTIFTIESPVTGWSSQLSCSFYEVDFAKSGVPNAIRRDVQTSQQFEDQVILDDVGVQIDIFKKIADVIDPNTQLRKSTLKPYAIVKRCMITSDGFTITEGALAGHNQSFQVLDPIIYPQ